MKDRESTQAALFRDVIAAASNLEHLACCPEILKAVSERSDYLPSKLARLYLDPTRPSEVEHLLFDVVTLGRQLKELHINGPFLAFPEGTVPPSLETLHLYDSEVDTEDVQHLFGSCKLIHLGIGLFDIIDDDDDQPVRDPLTRISQVLPPTLTTLQLSGPFCMSDLTAAFRLLPHLLRFELCGLTDGIRGNHGSLQMALPPSLEYLHITHLQSPLAILSWYRALRKASFLPNLRGLPSFGVWFDEDYTSKHAPISRDSLEEERQTCLEALRQRGTIAVDREVWLIANPTSIWLPFCMEAATDAWKRRLLCQRSCRRPH